MGEHPMMILAALEEERFNPLDLIMKLRDEYGTLFQYKRAKCLAGALRLPDKDDESKKDRWRNLRILIVDHMTVMNAVPLGQSQGGLIAPFKELKEDPRWRYGVKIIGVSSLNMYSKLLVDRGCDATCAYEGLLVTIASQLKLSKNP